MNLLTHILAVLFATSDDEERLAKLTVASLAERMDPETRDGIISLFSYRDPDIRALLWQTKYRHDARTVALLGGALAAYLRDTAPADVVLVPIPLSRRRFRERGYNQVEWVAREAVRALGYGTVSTALRRTRHTIPQTKLSRAERLVNLKGAFAVRNPDELRPGPSRAGPPIIVLDDVTTTGATLREARHACVNAGITDVRLLALAH